jgi:hypothetical protein
MLFTLNAWNLECIGVFNFIVVDKKIIKLKESDATKYMVRLSTDTGSYDSIISVSKMKYDRSEKGKSFGSCSVIRNIMHEDFITVVAKDNPQKAIRSLVLKSWGILLFLLIVLGLTAFTLLFFIP